MLNAASIVPDGPLQIHMKKNDREATPLLIACLYGAPLSCIKALLHPPKPLIDGGVLVMRSDRSGKTCMSGLLGRYEMYLKVPWIRNCNRPLEKIDCIPDANADIPDEISLYPKIIQHVDRRKCRKPRTRDNLQEGAFPNLGQDRSLEQDLVFLSFWHSVEALIQAAWSSGIEKHATASHHLRRTQLSFLHRAAYVSETLPRNLAELILRVFSSSASETYESNILPLHLAVTADHFVSQSNSCICSIRQRKFFISRLLELDPSAAKVPVPGTCGRSLLCQAIVSGLQWHIPSQRSRICMGDEYEQKDPRCLHQTNSNIKKDDESGPLAMIWMHHPDAICIRDPLTGLYPSLLASSLSYSDSTNGQDDICQLDTIYNLLRLQPQITKTTSS